MLTLDKFEVLIGIKLNLKINYYYYFSKGRFTEKESERKIFHLMVYFPNDHGGWDRARLKLSAKSILRISHTVGALFHCSPGVSAESWIESGAVRT